MRTVSVGPFTVPLPAVAITATVLLAVLVLGLMQAAGGDRAATTRERHRAGHSGAGGSQPAARESQPPVTAKPVLTLAYPTDGTRVSRSKGFTARGRAENLGASTVWMLGQNGAFLVDRPAVVRNGQWSVNGRALARSGRRGDLTVVLVLADAQCSARLTTVARSRDSVIAKLPAGCRAFDAATIRVTAG